MTIRLGLDTSLCGGETHPTKERLVRTLQYLGSGAVERPPPGSFNCRKRFGQVDEEGEPGFGGNGQLFVGLAAAGGYDPDARQWLAGVVLPPGGLSPELARLVLTATVQAALGFPRQRF